MKLLSDVEKDVALLPSEDRVALFDRLAQELNPPLIQTDHDAAQEAARRSAEMDRDPSSRLSFGEFREQLGWK